MRDMDLLYQVNLMFRTSPCKMMGLCRESEARIVRLFLVRLSMSQLNPGSTYM